VRANSDHSLREGRWIGGRRPEQQLRFLRCRAFFGGAVAKTVGSDDAPRNDRLRYSPFADEMLRRAVCVIRTSYRVFYTVWRFWRFLFSSNLSGLNNAQEIDSRRLHHSNTTIINHLVASELLSVLGDSCARPGVCW
jgi:hypothetical protein